MPYRMANFGGLIKKFMEEDVIEGDIIGRERKEINKKIKEAETAIENLEKEGGGIKTKIDTLMEEWGENTKKLSDQRNMVDGLESERFYIDDYDNNLEMFLNEMDEQISQLSNPKFPNEVGTKAFNISLRDLPSQDIFLRVSAKISSGDFMKLKEKREKIDNLIGALLPAEIERRKKRLEEKSNEK